MKNFKKIGLASLSTLMASSFLVSTLANAQVVQESTKHSENSITSPTASDTTASIEEELKKVDINELFRVVSTDLGIYSPISNTTPIHNSGGISTQGWKTMLAKEVAKKLITNLKNVGSRAWDSKITGYIKKLPLTDNAKTVLGTYLGYHYLMNALNIMIDFEGTAEEGLSYGLQYVGLPAWLSDAAARGVIFFLL